MPKTPPQRSLDKLTREKIIAAAVALVDRDGPANVTMRSLAKELGVTPMALYNHVSSKRELLQCVAIQILDKADFDTGHNDWRNQIEDCFLELRRVCLRNPGAVQLMELKEVAPTSIFRPMEITLRALEQLHLDPTDALRAYFALVNFTLGQVSYEIRGPFPDLDPSEAVRTKRLAAKNYPAVERTADLTEWDFDRAFAFGLTLLLDGIERVTP